jgi:hypothetical protein
MRWILIAIVAVIGVLAIVLPMPQVLNWAPKMAHTAMGMGIGCLVSAVGLIFVPVLGRPFIQTSGSSGGGATVIGGAQFSPGSWLEWVVLVVPIVGGIAIGALI